MAVMRCALEILLYPHTVLVKGVAKRILLAS
jgi:hypothetical protein